MPPGTYTIQLHLEDLLSKRTTSTSIKAKVLPKTFGIIHIEPSGDPEGQVPSSPICVIGESLYVHYALVGFSRDKKSKEPNLSVALRIFDKNGKETMPVPLAGKADAETNIPQTFQIIPFSFAFTLNRTGEYTIELSAKDELTGKTAKERFPVKVISLQ